MSLIFACFHLPPPNEGTARTYWALFALMAASVRRAAPGACVHLLTHAEAELPDGLAVDAVFRRPAGEPIKDSFAHLMLAEAESWRAYGESDLLRGPTVLCDVDILVQRDPGALFDGGFDIGLTYTTEPTLHPVNAGVILIDPARRDVVQDFFASLAARVAGYSPEHREWYGDQMALAAALGDIDVAEWRGIVERRVGAARLRLWPAAAWNHSLPLDPADRPVFAPAPDAGIVHFKGERKALMLRYATEVLGIAAVEDTAAPGGWAVDG